MPRVTGSAKQVDGVEKVQVDLGTQTVTVTYDVEKTNPDAIAKSLKDGGDWVTTVETE